MRVLIAGADAPAEQLKVCLKQAGFDVALAADDQQWAARLPHRSMPSILLELGPFASHRMVLSALEACAAAERLQQSDDASSASGSELTCGELRLDVATGASYVHDRVLPLTPREQVFLRELMLHEGLVVPKEKLHRAVFAADGGTRMQALAVIAHRLRKKLVLSRAVLLTVRGLGYALRARRPDGPVD
jgi:hypothetical protein